MDAVFGAILMIWKKEITLGCVFFLCALAMFIAMLIIGHRMTPEEYEKRQRAEHCSADERYMQVIGKVSRIVCVVMMISTGLGMIVAGILEETAVMLVLDGQFVILVITGCIAYAVINKRM